MSRTRILLVGLLGLVLAVSGCGVKPSTPQSGSSTTQKETQTAPKAQTSLNTANPMDKSLYSGADNLKKFAGLAAQNVKDYQAQINAGMSAYTNQDYTKAIEYYNKAIALNSSNAVAYNNIGNVYYRGLKDPKTALQYYVKATKIQPSYNYSWLNMALCQKDLKDIAGAKATVTQGLKVLGTGDPLYKSLTQLQSQLK